MLYWKCHDKVVAISIKQQYLKPIYSTLEQIFHLEKTRSFICLWIGSWISIRISQDHQESQMNAGKIKTKNRKERPYLSQSSSFRIWNALNMHAWMCAKRLSRVWLCNSYGLYPPQVPLCPWDSLARILELVAVPPPPWIFLPQGSNPPLSCICSMFFTTSAT